MYVTIGQVTGTVAMWAVRQSPYPAPDNLETVLRKLHDLIKGEFDQFGLQRFDDSHALETYISERLRAIPQYLAWNERKNGNSAPFNFVSRYDGPGDPDNDFIDLDALERNVANTIQREEREIA